MRRLVRDRRGGVTLIAAGSMTALMAMTALAVDMGSVYLAKRRLQGAADAAALAAAVTPDSAASAATGTIDANGLADARLVSAEPGSYSPDASLPVAARFQPGGTGDNAVRVTLSQQVPLYFGRILTGRDSVTIGAQATAARIDYAAFSIGSRLASVQGGLPNALLSGLIGTDLDLSVMDYQALVGGQIDLLAFASALRTRLNLSAASFGDTLSTSASLPTILSALADASADPDAATTLRALALKAPPTMVRLSDLIDLGPYAGQDSVPTTGTRPGMNAYGTLEALLQLAGGGRQVSLDLGASIPGLLATTVTLATGERPAHSPWLAIAQDNSVTVRTAQTRLYLDTTLGGLATLGIVSVHLPLYVELAPATARLKAIDCSGGASNATVTLSAQPGVGHVAIADLDTAHFGDFSGEPVERPATIARALFTVTGQADVDLGGVSSQDVIFSGDDIASHRIRTVATGDVTQGVAASLVSGLQLHLAGLSLAPVTALVGALLTPAAPVIDGLLDQFEDLLGVHVGEADMSVDGVRCGQPALVA